MMRKRKRSFGKRIGPVILSVLMVVSNIGGSISTAFGYNMKPVIMLQSEFLKEAAREALGGSGIPLSGGEYKFINVEGVESEEYARLFDGDVYEINPEYRVAADENGAKLKVFVTESEEVIFLFENHSDREIIFWAKLDDEYINSHVTVSPYDETGFKAIEASERTANVLALPEKETEPVPEINNGIETGAPETENSEEIGGPEKGTEEEI